MMDVSLAALANQTFFVQLEERAYTIRIHAGGSGICCADIARDEEVLVTGARIVAGWPLLPYRYQETGNFLLLTQGEELPDFTQFGVTQFLVYVTEAEIAELRAA